ncbi:hypothetical protein VDG1235_1933 [Verrucomicrobiia bacterium DG1235]|nr:hypothetical protein VDG1235_1933 [Verrucomicrobiae bacterium DG1235]
MEVKKMRFTEDGFELTFTRPVDRKSALRKRAYSISNYFYNYHEAYGSEKFDERKAKIDSTEVSDNNLVVTLRLRNLEAWRIYDLKLKGVESIDGHEVLNPWIVYTVNRLLKETPPARKPIPVEATERRTPVVPEGGYKSVGEPMLQ